MTIKLIKRNQQVEENKQEREPNPAEIQRTAQSWVNEFKQRKAKGVSVQLVK